MPPPPLGPEELEVVDEALEEIRTEEGPVDRGPIGCVLALPAFVLLLVVPVLGRRFGLPQAVATPIILVAIVLLVAGLTLWFTAGGFVRGHVTAAAEAALRNLESWDPEAGRREEALRAATLLVMNAWASYGPTTTEAFDRAEARERLGATLPLVESVEEHLVARGVTFRVFTEGEHTDEGAAPEASPPDGEG
jgi:hypothetical protein